MKVSYLPSDTTKTLLPHSQLYHTAVREGMSVRSQALDDSQGAVNSKQPKPKTNNTRKPLSRHYIKSGKDLWPKFTGAAAVSPSSSPYSTTQNPILTRLGSSGPHLWRSSPGIVGGLGIFTQTLLSSAEEMVHPVLAASQSASSSSSTGSSSSVSESTSDRSNLKVKAHQTRLLLQLSRHRSPTKREMDNSVSSNAGTLLEPRAVAIGGRRYRRTVRQSTSLVAESTMSRFEIGQPSYRDPSVIEAHVSKTPQRAEIDWTSTDYQRPPPPKWIIRISSESSTSAPLSPETSTPSNTSSSSIPHPNVLVQQLVVMPSKSVRKIIQSPHSVSKSLRIICNSWSSWIRLILAVALFTALPRVGAVSPAAGLANARTPTPFSTPSRGSTQVPAFLARQGWSSNSPTPSPSTSAAYNSCPTSTSSTAYPANLHYATNASCKGMGLLRAVLDATKTSSQPASTWADEMNARVALAKVLECGEDHSLGKDMGLYDDTVVVRERDGDGTETEVRIESELVLQKLLLDQDLEIGFTPPFLCLFSFFLDTPLFLFTQSRPDQPYSYSFSRNLLPETLVSSLAIAGVLSSTPLFPPSDRTVPVIFEVSSAPSTFERYTASRGHAKVVQCYRGNLSLPYPSPSLLRSSSDTPSPSTSQLPLTRLSNAFKRQRMDTQSDREQSSDDEISPTSSATPKLIATYVERDKERNARYLVQKSIFDTAQRKFESDRASWKQKEARLEETNADLKQLANREESNRRSEGERSKTRIGNLEAELTEANLKLTAQESSMELTRVRQAEKFAEFLVRSNSELKNEKDVLEREIERLTQIISRNSNPLSSINPSPPLGPSSTSSASSSSVLDVSIPLQQDPVIPQASSTTTDPSHTISSSSASASELPSPPPSNAAPTSAPAISSTFASTPGLSPFSGHEWIAAGNMQSLGVKKPSNDHVMLIDTGKEDLPLESFHYMDPKSLANFPIGEKKGVLGCSRLAMNGKFGRHAHSLRQTPRTKNPRGIDQFEEVLEHCPKIRMDAYATGISFKNCWETPAAKKWASQNGASALLVLDMASWSVQSQFINALNVIFRTCAFEAKAQDFERPRLRVLLVKTVGLSKQHSKKVIGYSPKWDSVVVWGGSGNPSKQGYGLGDSDTTHGGASNETFSLHYYPNGSLKAIDELAALDKYDRELFETDQIIAVTDSLVIPSSTVDGLADVLKAKKKWQDARYNALKPDRDQVLSDSKKLLESFAPPINQFDIDSTLTFDRNTTTRPAVPAKPPVIGDGLVCYKPELATLVEEDGRVPGFLGCPCCFQWAGRRLNSNQIGSLPGHDVPHPHAGSLTCNPFCSPRGYVSSAFVFISMEEVRSRGGDYRRMLQEENAKMKRQALLQTTSSATLYDILYGWYSTLTSNLVGVAAIKASLLAYVNNLDHPRAAYYRSLSTTTRAQALGLVLVNAFGRKVYLPNRDEPSGRTIRKDPELFANKPQLILEHRIRLAQAEQDSRPTPSLVTITLAELLSLSSEDAALAEELNDNGELDDLFDMDDE